MMALLALTSGSSFQFLGIPPKGEHSSDDDYNYYDPASKFPISRDPPEGGTFTTPLTRGSSSNVYVSNF